jgi:hypothetical protein
MKMGMSLPKCITELKYRPFFSVGKCENTILAGDHNDKWAKRNLKNGFKDSKDCGRMSITCALIGHLLQNFLKLRYIDIDN